MSLTDDFPYWQYTKQRPGYLPRSNSSYREDSARYASTGLGNENRPQTPRNASLVDVSQAGVGGEEGSPLKHSQTSAASASRFSDAYPLGERSSARYNAYADSGAGYDDDREGATIMRHNLSDYASGANGSTSDAANAAAAAAEQRPGMASRGSSYRYDDFKRSRHEPFVNSNASLGSSGYSER